MATYLLAAEREQPHGSRDESATATSDLTPATHDRDRLVADERVRMFYQLGTPEGRRVVRHLHIVAMLGVGVTGMVVWWWCGAPVGKTLLWCSFIFMSESAITVSMRLFSSRERASDELPRWAWIKTGVSALNGISWSVGPILLHVSDQPLSVLAPDWGILNYTGAAVWDGAYFAPSIFAMLAGVTLPATVWLFFYGGDIGLFTSICLGASLPFWMGLGWLSSQKIGEAITARIEIADLLEVQRIQTQEIRDAHHERNRFFSAASHDLRQPLHAMGFYNSLLSRAASESERSEILARLSECASSLDRQFNAIIGVAQTDAAVEYADIDATPLQEIMDRVILNVRPEAEAKSLTLRNIRTGLWVSVAPELLERVLTNLVSNAIKYTPAGGILLGARRRGARVELMVVDTGIGIAQENRSRIFQDFFQISNRERDSRKGFGLGLGIVGRLCAGMNWDLGLRSVVGRGTAFSVGVPLADSARTTRSAELREPCEPDPSRSEKNSVLFIDDDVLVRDAMQRMLADWDFSTTTCETGSQALAILDKADPAIRWHVLLDFRLAGNEDGLTVADQIAGKFGNRVRITLMSGETNDDLQQGARQRGITLLRKPVKPIRLRAILTSV